MHPTGLWGTWVEVGHVGCKAGSEFQEEVSEMFSTTANTFRLHVYGTPLLDGQTIDDVTPRKPEINDVYFFVNGK